MGGFHKGESEKTNWIVRAPSPLIFGLYRVFILELLKTGEFTFMEVVHLFQGSQIYMFMYTCVCERGKIHMGIIKAAS